jgi:AraC family transcriptional regulator
MPRVGLEQVTANSFRGLGQFRPSGDAGGVSYYISNGRPYTLEFSSEEDIVCLVLGDITNRTKFDDDKECDLNLIGGSINFHPRGGHFRVNAHEVRHGFVAFRYSENFRGIVDDFNVERLRRSGNQNNLRNRTIGSLVAYARERLRGPDELLPLELEFLATEAYLEAARKLTKASVAVRGSVSEAQFTKLNDFIEENLEGKILCADLATEVGLPLRAIFEGVKARTGHSLYRLVIEKRIKRAQQMLLQRGTSIADIAVTCGFCSQQHMTGTFSRKLGVTPQQFRSHPVKYGKG